MKKLQTSLSQTEKPHLEFARYCNDYKCFQKVKEYLSKGLIEDINYKNGYFLFIAAERHCVELMTLLFENRANVGLEEAFCEPANWYLCGRSWEKVIASMKLLLERGANAKLLMDIFENTAIVEDIIIPYLTEKEEVTTKDDINESISFDLPASHNDGKLNVTGENASNNVQGIPCAE